MGDESSAGMCSSSTGHIQTEETEIQTETAGQMTFVVQSEF